MATTRKTAIIYVEVGADKKQWSSPLPAWISPSSSI